MKKQFLRVKQIADQTFLRAEKTEVLTEDLVNAEKRVDIIKQSFQAAYKKISSCQVDFGSEGSAEKRMKKLPQVALAASMLENGYSFCKSSVLGTALKECASTQAKLGNELLEYYNGIEKSVLKPMSSVLENEIHNISKLRKQLGKLTLDMDSARNRFLAAERQQAASSSGGPNAAAAKIDKVDTLKDELEEASQKVDQCRDALACEMFSLISKEPHLSEIFLHFHQLQANYHRNALAALEASLPVLEKEIEDFPQKPVYGCSLQEHLRVTNRSVAHVIETCVYFLLEYGISEEGLLRIAGGASKLKKLKSAFDAGLDIDMTEYIRDPHAVSGALKSYLRELPEPLLTFSLYEEWMNAARVQDFDQRLQALWQVLHKLPDPNYVNLQYVVKFLSKLHENSDVNKMSSQNIAIVMAPNLIWAPNEDSSFGMNMQTANLHSSIVDTLVTYADWFFPDAEFPITPKSGSSVKSQRSEVDTEDILLSVGSFSDPVTSSPKSVHKSNKKPAAPPPPAKRPLSSDRTDESAAAESASDKVCLPSSGAATTASSDASTPKAAGHMLENQSLSAKESASSPNVVIRRKSNENIASLGLAQSNKTEKPSIPEKPPSYSSYSLDRKLQRASFTPKSSAQEKLLEYVPRAQRPTVPPPDRPAKPSRFSAENSYTYELQKPVPKCEGDNLTASDCRNAAYGTKSEDSGEPKVICGGELPKHHSNQDSGDQNSQKSRQNRFDFLVAQTLERPPERPPRSVSLMHEVSERTSTSGEGSGTSYREIEDEICSPCSPKAETPLHVDSLASTPPVISKSPEGERTKPPRPQPPIPFAKPKLSLNENTSL